MRRNNLDNPLFLFILLVIIITVNTISSIHFLLIMLAGVLFTAFYNCLKKKYLYSLILVIFTFLFIEINTGLKPFSLTMLSFFLYIFIIPRIENIVSFSSLNPYIYIILFYIGVLTLWHFSGGLSENIFTVLSINAIIDLIFFGVFI